MEASSHLNKNDEQWMQLALAQAEKAYALDEVPVGAVIVQAGKIIGEGFNQPIRLADPTAHAEVQAIRSAASYLKNYRLPGSTLYVTVEPCTMCLGTMIHARVERIVFAATEPKAGVLVSQPVWQKAGFFNHTVQWQGGVLEEQAAKLMAKFFKARREKKKALKKLSSSKQ